MASSSARRLKPPYPEEAFAYMKKLKESSALLDNGQSYKEFLELLNSFHAEKINYYDFVQGVIGLPISDDVSIIQELNTFLPETYETDLDEALAIRSMKPEVIASAKNFVDEIKNRFPKYTYTRKRFLQLLISHKKDATSYQETNFQISLLFQNDRDLDEKFKAFHPESFKVVSNLMKSMESEDDRFGLVILSNYAKRIK